MSQISMKSMLDAGVHFGHQTTRWNPKMKPYVYTKRGGIHIIDLQKSVVGAKNAGDFIKSVGASGGRIIFVGTKKQAIDPIQEAAAKCDQYYITKRWLGGTLTNFTTIKIRIDRMKKIERMKEKGDINFYSKKERGKIEKEYIKLCAFLNGIRDMKEPPQAVFVVDLNKEHIAVLEAKRLGIPVIAIADTNTNPEVVDYPIPGNDDAIRSIKLFSNFVADCYLEGLKDWEVKLREEAAKAPEETEKPKEDKKAKSKKADATEADGPAVVKINRKFVAAGTAEDVEIAMELDKEATAEKPEDAADAATIKAATDAAAKKSDDK